MRGRPAAWRVQASLVRTATDPTARTFVLHQTRMAGPFVLALDAVTLGHNYTLVQYTTRGPQAGMHIEVAQADAAGAETGRGLLGGWGSCPASRRTRSGWSSTR